MTKTSVQQALYGYSDGHRLLSASVELDPAAGRLLRAATDMTFDSSASSYATLLPVPSISMYAFVRTWPAEDWLRTGSVWSHVLLVDFVSLGRMASTLPVSELFRRPEARTRGDFERDLSNYKNAVSLAGHSSLTSPQHDPDLVRPLLERLYGSDESVSQGVRDVARFETLLYEIQSQQWPRLRRTFSARTRARTSDASWHVDIELVEKGPTPVDRGPSSLWIGLLEEDLRRPVPGLRPFLQRYGAESRRGRADMGALTALEQTIDHRSYQKAVDHLRRSFRSPSEMKSLKRDLLGAPSDATLASDLSEPERLSLAFLAGDAVDFQDLAVGRRLLALGSRGNKTGRLRDLPLDNVGTQQIEQLVGDIAEHSGQSDASALAVAAPDLGLLIAARKPTVLEDARVWAALDGELLVEILHALAPRNRRVVLRSLVAQQGVAPLVFICERDRTAWWSAALQVGSVAQKPGDLIEGCSTLRQVLVRVGAASLDPPRTTRHSPGETAAVLLAADLADGLWRRFTYGAWSTLLSASNGNWLKDMPEYFRDRICAVTLLSATSGGDSTFRRTAWEETFAHLHRRLEDPAFDGEAWRLLDGALPSSGGADWDRCLRLRRGVALEMRRASWSESEVEHFLNSAAESSADLRRLLEEGAPRRRHNPIGELFDAVLNVVLGR